MSKVGQTTSAIGPAWTGQEEPVGQVRSGVGGRATGTRAVGALVAVAGLLLAVGQAWATPVATSEEERDRYGRVFLEPVLSTEYVQFGTSGTEPEFQGGMQLLEDLYPEYLEFTTIAEELGQPHAVSVGPDGVPSWDPDDTGDGWPFHVVSVTDESVADAGKQYVLITVAHSAEACGREAVLRYIEDLLLAVTEDPERVLRDGTGTTGVEHEIAVAEALERVKLLYVSTSPDGWAQGDGPGQYSQYNGAGINNNRVAYQDGWVFPAEPVFHDNGYAVLTEPEGAAVTEYLAHVRESELGGRPFAAHMDFHGPLPVGALLFMDQGNTPAKLLRLEDLAERIKQGNDQVLASYLTQQGLEAHQLAAASVDELRLYLLDTYAQNVGPAPDNALYLTPQWAEYGTPWEHINYTVSGSYAGWASSHTGLDADALAYENPCEAVTGSWNPAAMQLYVDNLRSTLEVEVVRAAFRDGEPELTFDLGGTVGYLDHGVRVTDADGNPSPPPSGYPGNPFVPQVVQAPYDVANTDYFEHLREIVDTPIVAVAPGRLAEGSDQVATLVVADTTDADPAALTAFVEGGGNLVLTDAALQLLPDLLPIEPDHVELRRSYVGYADLVEDHPWVEGLYPRARQLFDPVGLGYPLMMARDNYWPGGTTSPTENSAPIWSVDRAAWEAAGGSTIGTVDPPEDPRSTGEGFDTDRTAIGAADVGAGRIVVFGGILPQPTEQHPHWFGLNAYTVSIPGQHLLLDALTWDRQGTTPAGGTGGAAPGDASADGPGPTPVTGGALVLPALLALAAAATGAAGLRRRQSP